MKKFIFLLGAMLIFSVSSAQTQREATEAKSAKRTTTVKAADGSTLQQTTTTTTTDANGNDAERQNTSDIITPVGAKVNATDGQTAPASATDPDNTDTMKTTRTTTTTRTSTNPRQ